LTLKTICSHEYDFVNCQQQGRANENKISRQTLNNYRGPKTCGIGNLNILAVFYSFFFLLKTSLDFLSERNQDHRNSQLYC